METDYQTLPVLSRDIIARKDENGILLFQVHTDEMYFVPFTVYHSFLAKCNGAQTIGEIMEEAGIPQNTVPFNNYLQELLNRQIISLW